MIPCKDCLLIPACRHKPYQTLLNDCSLVAELLYINKTGTYISAKRQSGFIQSIYEVKRILKPLYWKTRQRYSIEGSIDIIGRKVRKRR